MPTENQMPTEKTVKKRGRPKSTAEKRKTTTISILPSLYNKALEKAYSEGKSFAQVIEDFLTQYING